MLGTAKNSPYKGGSNILRDDKGPPDEDNGNPDSSDGEQSFMNEALKLDLYGLDKVRSSCDGSDSGENICPGIGCYSQTGKFRIIVVGDSGIGKTALVKKFLSGPEILGTETVPSQMGTIEFSRGSTQMAPLDSKTLNSSLSASVKPLRSEGNGSGKGARSSDQNTPARSTNLDHDQEKGDSQRELNYNLTFIDVPGFGMHVDAMNVIRPVIELLYIQYHQTNKYFNSKVRHLERFLMSPNGAHTHVDVCLFGILHRVKGVDIEFMRHLSRVVNVIPLILKSDTLKESEIMELKLSTLRLIKNNSFSVYTFGKTVDELIALTEKGELGYIPFAISSAIEPDLNSPRSKITSSISDSSGKELQNPLISEFETLKSKMLLTHINDLRYRNALKFVEWREKLLSSRAPQGIPSPNNADHPLSKNKSKSSGPQDTCKTYGGQEPLGFAISTLTNSGQLPHLHHVQHHSTTNPYYSRPAKHLVVDTKPQTSEYTSQTDSFNPLPTPICQNNKASQNNPDAHTQKNNSNSSSSQQKQFQADNGHLPENSCAPSPPKNNNSEQGTACKQSDPPGLVPSAPHQSSSPKTAAEPSHELSNPSAHVQYCSSAPSSPIKCKDDLSPDQSMKDGYKINKSNVRHMGVIYGGSSPNLHQPQSPNKPPSIVGKVLGKLKSRRS